MAKTGLLSPLRVGRETKPGRFCDGGGLYLQIKPGGSKSWLFRWKAAGKTRMLGLGAFPDVSLAAAREKATAQRAILANGLDPLEAREAEQLRRRVAAAQSMTFQQCAEAFISSREANWKNPKHRQQWRNTLVRYAYRHIGDLPVGEITPRLVLNILQQTVAPKLDKDGALVLVGGIFWNARPEQARRLRARIEVILDWARVNQYRQGDNPARWQGNLAFTLDGGQKRRHHPALPYRDVAGFTKELREQGGSASAALEFLILTAARTGEVLGARWEEFDEENAVWMIPAGRMKAGREHRVPLAPAALAVLSRMRSQRRGDFVFPGARNEETGEGDARHFTPKPLSNMALLALLRRMKRDDITPHGMRSCFRDWAAEETDFANEVPEMALAHAVSDAVEKAYRRGDLFKKRRALMEAWASHVNGVTTNNVVRIDGRAA